MKITLTNSALTFEPGVLLLSSVSDIKPVADGIPVSWQPLDHLEVCWDGSCASLGGSNTVQFFRGLGLLKEHLTKKTEPFCIREDPVFTALGASFDLSRNALMTPDAMERMLCRMALMGYNEAYLYTEETYELPDYPFFGYMRGRYTAEDIRSLDQKAALLGIELIPCIQTLGHLERFLHWESSAPFRDTPDVLLADETGVYDLIEAMFRQCRSCYHTHKIHIGMDEAMNLGLGEYLKKHGFQNSFSIMLRHVSRVRDLAHKYQFHPMMWSDMYFRCASPGHNYYEDEIEIPEWVTDSAPEDVELVYWDYYHPEQSFYDRYIRLHQKFKSPLRFAGGMWTWLGPAIDYDVFFRNSYPALLSCVKHGIRNVMLTSWGDDGGETSPQAMLLGLQAYAEFDYRQIFDKEQIAPRLFACTGADADALSMISRFNKTDYLSEDSDLPNGAKFLLYQDPLCGIYDADVDGMGFSSQYASLENCFENYAQRNDQWQTLYRFYSLLARVLKNKAELGCDLQRAYRAKDIETLRALTLQARTASKDCTALLEQWRKLWLSECRPFGFEVLEVRLAGVSSRLNTAAERVEQYCDHRISSLEELEIQRLPLLRNPGTSQMHGVYFWRDIVSAAKPW